MFEYFNFSIVYKNGQFVQNYHFMVAVLLNLHYICYILNPLHGKGCEWVIKLFKSQSHLFYRILIMCILLVAAVTILVSTAHYVNYERSVTAQNAVFIQDSLEKVSNSAVFMSDWITNIAVQINYDNDIVMMLNKANIEPQRVVPLRNRLVSIRMSSPYISSIYVYNGITKRIYSDIGNTFEYTRESFYDPDIFRIIDNKDVQMHLKPIPRLLKYTLDGRFEFNDEVYSFVLFENITNHRPQDNAIVINVSRKWLDNAIQSLDKNTASNLIIVDRQYKLVYGAGILPVLTDMSGDEAIKTVMESEKPNGYFVDGSGPARQLITYVRGIGKQADWVCVYRMPVAVLTQDISAMQQATLLFAGVMLIIGVAGAVGYAIIVYKPIGRLQRKLAELEKESSDHGWIERQEFIRSLFDQGEQEPNALAAAMQAHGIRFDPERPMRMVLIAIDGCSKIHGQPGIDAKARRAVIAGLINRVAQGLGQHILADMKSDHFVLAINTDDDSMLKVTAMLAELRSELEAAIAGLSVSCVAGPLCEGWASLPGQYITLKSGLSQRVFEGYGCTIELKQLKSLNTSGYDYPAHKEKQMCQLLMTKQPQVALQSCREIVLGVRSFGGNMLQVTLLRITSAIMEITEKLNSESGIHITYDFDGYIANLGTMETLQEITDGYARMFYSIVDQMNSRKALDHKVIVDRIMDGICTRYADSALTIESFEPMFGLSGIHLARLFRRFTGQSFADCLRELRLEKAKALITVTNVPVQQVAEQVGIANVNYIYTLFKKEYGITPAEFRQRQIDIGGKLSQLQQKCEN